MLCHGPFVFHQEKAYSVSTSAGEPIVLRLARRANCSARGAGGMLVPLRRGANCAERHAQGTGLRPWW